jgi:hypothetical protein
MGVSRATAYKWLRRFAEEGGAGLMDRSSRPRTCPTRADDVTEAAMVALRRDRRLGPAPPPLVCQAATGSRTCSGVGGGMARPLGRSTPASSKRITPLHSRLHPCSGWNAITVEEIADAAAISPRTFFRYFPTKEDVVVWDEYDPLALELLQSRPDDEPLAETVFSSVHGFGLYMSRPMAAAAARMLT